MSRAEVNGIRIEYEQWGDLDAPVILLIMGLGVDMGGWDQDLVSELAAQGFRVVRFDNRDVGLSTYFDEAGTPDLALIAATGELPPPAYTMDDMAADVAGLLDFLAVAEAHIVGASMGGMIAQTFALAHPGRTRSLTSIMSTTGAPEVGQPRPDVVETMFLAPRPATREEAIEGLVRTFELIGSPGFPPDEGVLRRRISESYDRAFHPEGIVRQLVAILHQPDRTEALRRLTRPTLVIHGEDDPLVDVSGGRATAAAVPGAELWTVPGMGHDLPLPLHDELVHRIAGHCRRAGP